MEEENEYVQILKALLELPFQVGKNLLADFLTGNYSNKSITKNRLDELPTFDSLNWPKEKIFQEIDRLISNKMIELTTSDYNRFVKILALTLRGRNEIIIPTLNQNKISEKIDFNESPVTEQDKQKFEELNSFLENYNDEQKKAIISESNKILCIAGAGSGKTTVLTKRIEHLVKNKNTDPRKILAITFTKKAREEMQRRLLELRVQDVNVHTFNSFCEQILRKYQSLIYGRPVRVQSYQDKILAMNMALMSIGLDMELAIDSYFTQVQKKSKTRNQLANSFMNDCFSVLDYFKTTGQQIYDFSTAVNPEDKRNAKMIYQIIKYLESHMQLQGLRDFTDQIIDAKKFLIENPEKIPEFSHILIDEYQDVNSMQIALLDILNSPNIFAVGDPRQSIFGWRGSDIGYILDFEKKYSDSQTIHLTKNYRSSKSIVQLMNKSIEEMKLPDLQHNSEEKSTVKILNIENDDLERNFVVNKILESKIPRNEIFVLARTNRQLLDLSQFMKRVGIPHILKTDELKNPTEATEEQVTLATIHAIKGLEASTVFLIGATEQNFPCKASDHPAIEMIKSTDYNKDEEEKRLFYVAISRAKKNLYITHTSKRPTYFITEDMINLLD